MKRVSGKERRYGEAHQRSNRKSRRQKRKAKSFPGPEGTVDL